MSFFDSLSTLRPLRCSQVRGGVTRQQPPLGEDDAKSFKTFCNSVSHPEASYLQNQEAAKMS